MTDAATPPAPYRADPHAHRHDVPVPKGAIIAVALVLAATVVLVAISQLTGAGQARSVTIEADRQFALIFSDGADGAIEVSDAASGEAIHAFDPDGQNGFVRVALRALIFDRQRAGVGPDVPFHLLTTPGGQAYLSDPATGQFVALNAFGGDNGTRFAPLVAAAEATGNATRPGIITLGGGVQ